LTAFYSIVHVSREKHPVLLRSFDRILKPDGIMLVCMGLDEWEATGKYHGVEMLWSRYFTNRISPIQARSFFLKRPVSSASQVGLSYSQRYMFRRIARH
jgi:ubiquinone/menaquinone biosynthesis C-methylase UbiE